MRTLSLGRVVGAVAALVAVVVLSGTPATAQGQKDGAGGIDLRPKFKAGQQTKYRMRITQTAKTKSKESGPMDGFADLAGDENTEHDIAFSLKVTSVDEDGTAKVELVYESVKVTGEIGGERVSVDTTKPATTDKGDQADLIRAMAGTKMSMVIDRDGNITQTSGGGGLLGGAGGGSDLLGPVFSPGKAPGSAKRGQSWTHIDEIGMGGLVGPMRLITTHTLESASNTEARVKVKGKIETGESSPGGGGKGTPTEMVKITRSDHAGSYVWDLERGQIKSMNSTMKSEIKLDMGGIGMTRTGDSVMKLERVWAEPVEKPAERRKDKDDPKPDGDSDGGGGAKPKR